MSWPWLLAALLSASPPIERSREPAPADGPAITVRGVLVTPEGQPLAGASVLLRAKTGGSFYHIGVRHNRDVLARTTSDERGSFAFDKIAIPLRLGGEIESLRRGTGGAQMVAIAAGRSLAWCEVKELSPATELKLTLASETPALGQVTGDSGQGLAGIHVRILGISRAANDIDSF